MAMEVSHIWLGRFPSGADLDAYFDEGGAAAEGGDGERKAPLNRFAADQGVRFYDHDWVEYSFCASGDLRELIEGHSFCEDYLEAVVALAAERGIVGANSFILADRDEFPEPQAVEGDGYLLWYLGEFPCSA